MIDNRQKCHFLPFQPMIDRFSVGRAPSMLEDQSKKDRVGVKRKLIIQEFNEQMIETHFRSNADDSRQGCLISPQSMHGIVELSHQKQTEIHG